MSSVGDGDTLRFLDGGQRLTILIACIDAPEIAQSPYRQQTREALQSLLPVGSTVTLKTQNKDRGWVGGIRAGLSLGLNRLWMNTHR